jgi:hypothetical protein
MIAKAITVLAVSTTIAGCSSQPKVYAEKPQYCHTSQDILVKDGERVESLTLVRCDDDQINRISERRLGMAKNCGEFTYWMKIGGRDVQRKAISCQKTDGSWEVINTVSR